MADARPTPQSSDTRRGLAFGLAAYGMWGLVPIYFKAVASVPALEVLAHRIVWSVAMLVPLLVWRRRWPEVSSVLADRRTLGLLLLTTGLVAINWYIFIVAVETGRVLQASLGYFINPLVNIFFGRVLLGEVLSRSAATAVAIAAIGVTAQVVMIGSLPVIALALAVSFGLYGLLRKIARVGAVVGLTVETSLLVPLALGYLVWLHRAGGLSFGAGSPGMDVLLIAGGLVTALPLLCFTSAARLLPLSTMGFLQYLAPSGQFLLAVLAYDEPLTAAHIVTFGCIWTALAVFSRDQLRAARRRVSRVAAPVDGASE